jgi:putative ABC transport system ATP-binding protein
VKDYPSSAGPVRALDSINLDIYPGELIGVIGRSGAGKTTLVNMVSGTDTITSGEVIVDGLSIHQLGESRLALWRGRNMGVIYQTFQLLPGLNLLDNVMLPMDFCGTFQRRRSRERALELLRYVEL